MNENHLGFETHDKLYLKYSKNIFIWKNIGLLPSLFIMESS